MNSLDVPTGIFLIIWISGMVKMVYDSMKLRQVYMAKIDPTFPVSIDQMDLSVVGQMRLIKRNMRMVFSRYPDHPDVDMYAKRYRRDCFGMLTVFLLAISAMIISTIIDLE